MSGENWTPGPWRVGKKSQRDVLAPNDYLVTRVHFDHMARGKESREAHAYSQANAHLIAAAPELYEALKAMVACEDNPMAKAYDGVESREAARKALAKACGETE